MHFNLLLIAFFTVSKAAPQVGLASLAHDGTLMPVILVPSQHMHALATAAPSEPTLPPTGELVIDTNELNTAQGKAQVLVKPTETNAASFSIQAATPLAPFATIEKVTPSRFHLTVKDGSIQGVLRHKRHIESQLYSELVLSTKKGRIECRILSSHTPQGSPKTLRMTCKDGKRFLFKDGRYASSDGALLAERIALQRGAVSLRFQLARPRSKGVIRSQWWDTDYSYYDYSPMLFLVLGGELCFLAS